MNAPLDFALRPNPSPASDAERGQVLAAPGFGKHFTDHMARARWTPELGWHDARVEAYGPLQLDPSAAVLHYAQEIFEGLKVYRWDDGSLQAFRPEANAARLARSAARLALPELPGADFLESLRALVEVDAAWVPGGGETSLYLRPFMFASESFLGVRAAAVVDYLVIASPAGSYFTGGVRPVGIWLSREYSRAGWGGTGAAKCGGNYASSLVAQAEAAAHGCEQVCFLDAAEQTYVEELGGMNVFFVHADGTLVTPELTGTILEGVTRTAILQLGREMGLTPVERRVSAQEWKDGAASGEITEVFACGTAAVITPIGRLLDGEDEVVTGGRGGAVEGGATEAGKVTSELRAALLDIQHGRVEDTHGWMQRLV